MSQVVSFRCSDELDEYLEQVAEERMTTKSTAAQMLLAEKVQEMSENNGGNGGITGVNTGDSGESDSDDLLKRFEDEWWEVDEEHHNYRVRMPPDWDGVKYQSRKTKDGVRSVLRNHWISDNGDDE